MAYLSGLVLGDGCLPNSYRPRDNNFEYKTTITSGDKEFITMKITNMFKQLFEKGHWYLRDRGNYIELEIKNKAIYRFFTNVIKMHSGKKAIKARVPKLFFEANIDLQIAFIAGLIDSDIGKHSGSLGCTFRSQKFVEDLVMLFDSVGITANEGGTYLIKDKYPQTDFRIPKKEVKTLKRLLSQHYLPKTKGRLKAINEIAGFR